MAINCSVEKLAQSIESARPPVFSQPSPRSAVPETLVTTYLQMTHWAEFRPANLNHLDGIKVMCMDTPDVAFYRFLCGAVSKQWRWQDRLSLSDEEIEAILQAPETSIHVLYVDGTPAGYLELVRLRENSVGRLWTEVAFFGLRPAYINRGLGKHLLSHGIAYAWNKGTQRLWARTCNLEGSYALRNYLKCGFKIYKVEKKPLPEKYLYR